MKNPLSYENDPFAVGLFISWLIVAAILGHVFEWFVGFNVLSRDVLQIVYIAVILFLLLLGVGNRVFSKDGVKHEIPPPNDPSL